MHRSARWWARRILAVADSQKQQGLSFQRKFFDDADQRFGYFGATYFSRRCQADVEKILVGRFNLLQQQVFGLGLFEPKQPAKRGNLDILGQVGASWKNSVKFGGRCFVAGGDKAVGTCEAAVGDGFFFGRVALERI